MRVYGAHSKSLIGCQVCGSTSQGGLDSVINSVYHHTRNLTMARLEDATITFYHMTKCPHAGPIKLFLTHQNFNYIDEPIKVKDWELRREEIIVCRVPALRIQHRDGRQEWMTEASAILRCLGEQYDLLGRNDMEAYHCDRIIGKIMDSGRILASFYKNRKFHSSDGKDQEEYKEKLFEKISVILQHLDRMLQEAPGSYAAADVITIADFYLLDFVDFFNANKPGSICDWLTDGLRVALEPNAPLIFLCAGIPDWHRPYF
ncbi:Glutathione S-transferase class-mu 28 kDa isozyme [Taenia crassiceps]|uniref:Glutathione S-transferase class-mu 28 kDa isozyme n=1 Tax=Taenia crassiceps TaxID=6207 RepID=A0ABR4QF54_9CEST